MRGTLSICNAQEGDGTAVGLGQISEGNPPLLRDQEGHVQGRCQGEVLEHGEEVLPAHRLGELPRAALPHDDKRPERTAWRAAPSGEPPSRADVQRRVSHVGHEVPDRPGAVVTLDLAALALRVERIRAPLGGEHGPQGLVPHRDGPQDRLARLESASSCRGVPPRPQLLRPPLVGIGKVGYQHWLLGDHPHGHAKPEVSGAQQDRRITKLPAAMENMMECGNQIQRREVPRLLVAPVYLNPSC
mmetsp:Transcript_28836/g.85822  ORF Transcript_28836/g.85822 Transcript_28836/m.85822 type:complete len:244 (+) Transcript_28836:767-1498(+)